MSNCTDETVLFEFVNSTQKITKHAVDFLYGTFGFYVMTSSEMRFEKW